MRRLLLPASTLLLALAAGASAQQAATSPVGLWKTVDDATGKVKSIVEVYQARDGSFSGKVAEIIDQENGPDPLCEKCEGANHNKPVKGLVILWALKPDGNGKWTGGQVLDPENGKVYKSRLELMDGGRKLGMSGCIAFICRQQVWLRQ